MVIQTGIADFSSQRLRLAQTNSYTENKSDSNTDTTSTVHRQIDEADISLRGQMKSKLMSLREVQNNIEEASKMMETADKGIRAIVSILEKIKELAVQSANGIYTDSERQLFQVEISELIDEVDRISSSTEYNSMALFQGDFSRYSRVASMWLHIGPNQHERERIYLSTMTAQSLDLKYEDATVLSVSTPEEAKETLHTLLYSISRTQKQLADITGYSERFKEAQIKVRSEIETLEKALGENGGT